MNKGCKKCIYYKKYIAHGPGCAERDECTHSENRKYRSDLYIRLNTNRDCIYYKYNILHMIDKWMLSLILLLILAVVIPVIIFNNI